MFRRSRLSRTFALDHFDFLWAQLMIFLLNLSTAPLATVTLNVEFHVCVSSIFPSSFGVIVPEMMGGGRMDRGEHATCIEQTMKDEASYVCDSCGEEIVVPIDLSAGSEQEYVEDCPVCCCPNVVHVEVDEDGDVRVWASRE
jgi:hypothetical protein